MIKNAPVIEVLKNVFGEWGVVRIDGFVIPEITLVEVHLAAGELSRLTVTLLAADIKFIDEVVK